MLRFIHSSIIIRIMSFSKRQHEAALETLATRLARIAADASPISEEYQVAIANLARIMGGIEYADAMVRDARRAK
jgi:hypothetical protein